MENAQQTRSTGSEPRLQTGAGTGGRSVISIVLSLALMLCAGVALGFLCDLIGLRHPKSVFFRFLVGLPLAFVGVVLLYTFAFARRHVLVLAGIGGSAAMLTMHGLDYRDFPRRLEPRLRNVVEAQAIRQIRTALRKQSGEASAVKSSPEKRRAEEQALLVLDPSLRELEAKLANPEQEKEMEPVFRRFGEELAKVRARIAAQWARQLAQVLSGERSQFSEPVVGPWLDYLGLWGYLDLRAEQGVILDFFEAKVHLGYVCTFRHLRCFSPGPGLKEDGSPAMVKGTESGPPCTPYRRADHARR